MPPRRTTAPTAPAAQEETETPAPAPEPPAPTPIQPAEAPAPAPVPEPTAEQYMARRAALLATVPPAEKRPTKLYAKLAQILGLIHPVAKAGYNDFHRYNYAKESDLVEAVRPLLSEYGIFVHWTIIEHDRRMQVKRDRGGGESQAETLTVIKAQMCFVDGETGDKTDPQEVVAYGDDPGDKGIYKAMTGLMKYFLMKSFMISTGDDPEADNATDRRSAAGEASSRVEVRRGAPPPQRGRPQAQRPPQGPQQPPQQPGPGGRQAEANATSGRVLHDLLRRAGVTNTVAAAALLGQIAGVEIPMDGDDKPAALSAWLTERQKNAQAFGKLVYDLRKHVEGMQAPAAGEADQTGEPAEPEGSYEAGDAL